MTDERTTIRTYEDYELEPGIDAANQINWDLKGTFGWRAIAQRGIDTDEIVDWYAYHDEYNCVVCWWPDFYDEPVWRKGSIYSFSNPLRESSESGQHAYFTLHEWPDELDEDAEVIL